MFQPKIRKAGVPPFVKTKYDFQKSRPIEDYLSNKVPMQSDKLKERLLNANMLEPKCAVCGMFFWQQQHIPLELIEPIFNRIDDLLYMSEDSYNHYSNLFNFHSLGRELI